MAVNSKRIKFLSRCDFWSYPKTYPDILSAGAIRVGEAWYALIINRPATGRCREGVTSDHCDRRRRSLRRGARIDRAARHAAARRRSFRGLARRVHGIVLTILRSLSARAIGRRADGYAIRCSPYCGLRSVPVCVHDAGRLVANARAARELMMSVPPAVTLGTFNNA